MWKKVFLTYAFILILIVGYSQQTKRIYLSGKGSDDTVLWDFFCSAGMNSGKWSKIAVPSCWELQGFGDYNYGHDRTKHNETGTYKTTFHASKNWKENRVYIVFEGSMTDSEVKINGKLAGEPHQGAFYRFSYEITNLLKYGQTNRLEVKVDKMSANESINEAERQADFWVFGGIFRPVYLEIVPQKPIEFVAIDARHTGQVNASVFMRDSLSGLSARMDVFDLNNHLMGTVAIPASSEKTKQLILSGDIQGIQPWSAEFPNRYRAKIIVEQNGKLLHTVEEKIGFRTVEVRLRDGIYINGSRVMMKGVNRHSHWPSTGRTTSKQLSIGDVKLMKEMNMNAVRSSHYPPDTHFLEVCDSLGLYVMDELCAWQYPPYDTPVGKKLVREMVTRDLNHPSIIFWSNGNEGGFNRDLDAEFPRYDLQKRAVLHPWASHDGINTVHYINFNSGIKDMFNGRDIFMPTEILHGLYDGGHGAGLDDYWNLMLSNPRSAGLFLWDFVDQAVVRTDKNNLLDTYADKGADGILGPNREKEGSFFTIKEIWSPIQLEHRYITPQWNQTVEIQNRYNFTNTNLCTFTYQLSRINQFSSEGVQNIEGEINAPDIKPGQKGILQLHLPNNWQSYDFLYITVKDPYQQTLFRWSYELGNPERLAKRLLGINNTRIGFTQNDSVWIVSSANKEFHFSKKKGLLLQIKKEGKTIPLGNGPLLIGEKEYRCHKVGITTVNDSTIVIAVEYHYTDNKPAYNFQWTIKDDLLQLDWDYIPEDNCVLSGISFDYPEELIKGATLLAKGSYRSYNNRMKGGELGIWEKKYNDTRTGETWEYPEFKGYYPLFYAATLQAEIPFSLFSGSEDLTLHLFTPTPQQLYPKDRNYTLTRYPLGNLSFMDAIPSVGTKFGKAENYGPQSQPHRFMGAEALLKNRLYFKF